VIPSLNFLQRSVEDTITRCCNYLYCNEL